MQPGWYPDPFTAAMTRWWDGTAWTSHAQWVVPGLDAAADVTSEERAARRASVGLVAVAAVAIIGYLITAVYFGHEFRQFVQQARDNIRAVDQNLPAPHQQIFGLAGPQLVLDAFQLANIAAQVLFMIWLYRAANLARRAGLPARRATVWAWLGFIIPVVNLWFPYQVAADATPPGDPARRLVGWWWTWWICQSVASLLLAVVSYFVSRPVAVVLAIVLCVLPVAAALKGREMITAILAAHRRMLTMDPARR